MNKPDGYVIVLGTLNTNILLGIHDATPDFAWIAAERLSGMKEHQLRAVGYECRPVKLVFLDEEIQQPNE